MAKTHSVQGVPCKRINPDFKPCGCRHIRVSARHSWCAECGTKRDAIEVMVEEFAE